MTSVKNDKTLFIKPQTLTLLRLIKGGFLGGPRSLLDEKTAKEIISFKEYKGEKMPYVYIFAPFGKKNQATIKSLSQNERITLLVGSDIVGHIDTTSVFKFDLHGSKYINFVAKGKNETHGKTPFSWRSTSGISIW